MMEDVKPTPSEDQEDGECEECWEGSHTQLITVTVQAKQFCLMKDLGLEMLEDLSKDSQSGQT